MARPIRSIVQGRFWDKGLRADTRAELSALRNWFRSRSERWSRTSAAIGHVAWCTERGIT